MEWTKLIAYAGPLALSAFAGTMLGGVVLSLWWKNFGPWQILKTVQGKLDACEARDIARGAEHVLLNAQIAGLNARYDILKDAVNKAGLGLTIGPIGN